MSKGKSPTQYLGVLPQNPPNVIMAERAPTANDKAYNVGDIWVNTLAGTAYINYGGGLWITVGTGTTGSINSITGDTGGAQSPLAGNFSLLGTANQIVVTGGANKETFSLSATLVAPGTITAAAGNITATLGDIVCNGAGKHFSCHGGAATDFIGTATLVNGTVTIANTNIAAADRIMVTRSAKNASTAYGHFQVVKTAATNFVITACKIDTTTETGDQSTVEYTIIRQV